MAAQTAWEINFDGLVGPSHNYSGLSYGDVASMNHAQLASNPKKAALQGLSKMHTLFSLGVKQALFPPQERPFIPLLHSLGFAGSDSEVLEKALRTDPKLLYACSSASSMWMANAATVTPSADSNDGRVHITPANLMCHFHRSFEASTTGILFLKVFNHPTHFVHHYPLPFHSNYSDEGAANQIRFCRSYEQAGVHLFVYGQPISKSTQIFLPKRFPARQTEEAVRTLARLHRLSTGRVVFAQQNPEAIDAGVFHNDVISMGNQNIFLYHEKSFVNTPEIIQQLKSQFETHCQAPFTTIEVKNSEIEIEEALKTYLFNSQIVTCPDQTMAVIAPRECQTSPAVSQFLKNLLTNSKQPIRHVIYQDLLESMQNGGGPACLRLRIVLTKNQYDAMHPHILFTENLYQQLVSWVERHYRDCLTPDDLADPDFLKEGRRALDELTRILQLGSIYSFQRMSSAPPRLPEKR